MQRKEKSKQFKDKEKKVAFEMIQPLLLAAFQNLQSHDLKFHSSTIQKNVGGKWPGFSIQELEANLGQGDLETLNDGYAQLLKSANQGDTSSQFNATLSNGDNIRISSRVAAANMINQFGLNPEIVNALNYRQRLMLNDLIFDLVQPLVSGAQDPTYRDKICLYIGEVMNRCMAGTDLTMLGMDKAGDFKINPAVINNLEHMQPTAAATAAPGSPSLRGFFGNVASRLRSHSTVQSPAVSPAVASESIDSTIQRVKPTSSSAPAAMSEEILTQRTPSQVAAMSLARLDTRDPAQVAASIRTLAESLKDRNIAGEQRQCIDMLSKMQQAFEATTTPRSNNSAQLDLIKQCLVTYETREKTPYQEKLATMVGLIEQAKLTNSQFKDKCGEMLREHQHSQQAHYSPGVRGK